MTLSGLKRFIWQQGTLILDPAWNLWHLSFGFAFIWIRMIKIRCSFSVAKEPTVSKGFFGKAYPQTFVIRTFLYFEVIQFDFHIKMCG